VKQGCGEDYPTWLYDAYVEDLLDVPVVRGDLEDGGRLTLDARDVDRDHIVGHAAPTNVAVLLLHLEYLRPQPADIQHTTTAVCIKTQRGQLLVFLSGLAVLLF